MATKSRAPIDDRIQREILDAKAMQKQTGCSWGEALRIAGDKNHTVGVDHTARERIA